MIYVETEIEPPGLDTDGDDGEPYIGVHCVMAEGDGTRRGAFAAVPVAADDDDLIAAAMIETMLGAAAMRGPQLHGALRRRISGAS